MKQSSMMTREYLCMNCGAMQYIPRHEGQKKELWHAKDLYCYRCKTVHHHLEAPIERLEHHGRLYQRANAFKEVEKARVLV